MALEGKKLVASIDAKIIAINNTIKQYKKALVQNKEERITLSRNYKIDVKRYAELTQQVIIGRK